MKDKNKLPERNIAVLVVVVGLLTILIGFLFSRCVPAEYATAVYVTPLGLFGMVLVCKFGGVE